MTISIHYSDNNHSYHLTSMATGPGLRNEHFKELASLFTQLQLRYDYADTFAALVMQHLNKHLPNKSRLKSETEPEVVTNAIGSFLHPHGPSLWPSTIAKRGHLLPGGKDGGLCCLKDLKRHKPGNIQHEFVKRFGRKLSKQENIGLSVVGRLLKKFCVALVDSGYTVKGEEQSSKVLVARIVGYAPAQDDRVSRRYEELYTVDEGSSLNADDTTLGAVSAITAPVNPGPYEKPCAAIEDLRRPVTLDWAAIYRKLAEQGDVRAEQILIDD